MMPFALLAAAWALIICTLLRFVEMQNIELTPKDWSLVKEIVRAARLNLQDGRDIGKTLELADVERIEKALTSADMVSS